MPKLDPSIIAAAQAAHHKHGIPASVSLAQYGLESAWGEKDLGCFNYFGMKAPCDPTTHKPVVPFTMKRTREEDRYGHSYFIDAPFRAFASAEEAFETHGALFHKPAYARALAKLPDVDAFVRAMAPTYASGRNYAAALLEIIKQAGLKKYDLAS